MKIISSYLIIKNNYLCTFFRQRKRRNALSIAIAKMMMTLILRLNLDRFVVSTKTILLNFTHTYKNGKDFPIFSTHTQTFNRVIYK